MRDASFSHFDIQKHNCVDFIQGGDELSSTMAFPFLAPETMCALDASGQVAAMEIAVGSHTKITDISED